MRKNVFNSLLFMAVLLSCEKQHQGTEVTSGGDLTLNAEITTPQLNLNINYYPKGDEKIVRGNKYGVELLAPRGAYVHVDQFILSSGSPYISLYQEDGEWILDVDINLPANTRANIWAEGYWIPNEGTASDFDDFDSQVYIYTSH